MNNILTDVYTEAKELLSRFFAANRVTDWEDLFHDAYIRYLENNDPDMSDWDARARGNYFIRSVLNAHIRRIDVNKRERDAARSRYCNTPYTSLKYRTDGDLIFAIRNLHEKGFTIRSISEAAGMSTQRVGAMVKRRTFKDLH